MNTLTRSKRKSVLNNLARTTHSNSFLSEIGARGAGFVAVPLLEGEVIFLNDLYVMVYYNDEACEKDVQCTITNFRLIIHLKVCFFLLF